MDKTTENLGIQIANMSISNARLQAAVDDLREENAQLREQLESKEKGDKK